MAENAESEIVNLYQPKKRFIIPIDNFHVPKKLFKLFKRNTYTFKINNNFENVIAKCQLANRKDNGTWINSIILDSYLNLHFEKMAHSIECYDQNKLIGGLYGVHIGGCFFGESMFSLKNDGSKLALVSIINRLKSCGHKLFDTQFFTPHLGSMGGIEISKIKYEKILKANITKNIEFQLTDNEKEFLFAPK